VALKRAVPYGYHYIEAARPIPLDTDVNTVNFQNHGGLMFIYNNTVKFQKRFLDVSVTTFEYLYGYASTRDGHFVLFGIYRPGSAPLTNIFFDELFTVFELLMTYSCPVITVW